MTEEQIRTAIAGLGRYYPEITYSCECCGTGVGMEQDDRTGEWVNLAELKEAFGVAD